MAETEICYQIENDFRFYPKEQALLFRDLAQLNNNEILDTCDIDYFYNDLRIEDTHLSGGNFYNKFTPHNYLMGDEAYAHLMSTFFSATEEYRGHWVDKHLSPETIKAMPEFDAIARYIKEGPGYSTELIEKLKRGAALYEEFVSSPDMAKYCPEIWNKQKEGIALIKGQVARHEWVELQYTLNDFYKREGMQRFYDDLNRVALKKVIFWESCSFHYNRVIRSLVAIGSGVFAGVAASPAAVPAALALFEFSDSAGEELAKASWQKSYTLAEARGRIAYHAPFALAKGLSFQAGPWIGAAVYGSVTALEVGGEPLPYEVSFKNRLKAAGMHGGYAFSSSASWMVTLRWFMPAFFKFFRFTPSREFFPKRTTTVSVPTPATNPPQPGTRLIVSVEPQPPVVPIRRTLPKVVTTARTVPSPKAGHTVQKTASAEEAFSNLPLSIQGKLDGLISQIKKGLEGGIQLEQMRGVKAVNRQEGVWEATIFSPQKAKVLFKVEGTGCEQRIEILEYVLEK